jgi:hypothetical protein
LLSLATTNNFVEHMCWDMQYMSHRGV